MFTTDSCGPTLNAGGSNWNPKNVQPCVLTQDGEDVSRTLTARMDSSPSVEGRGPSIVAYDGGIAKGDGHARDTHEASDAGREPTAFKWSAGALSRSMPAYDDGTTPALVTEKPPAIAIQTGHTVQNGRGISSDDVSYTISTSSDQAVAEPIVMASGQTNAEIGAGGVAPTLTVLHEAPLLATALTCSPAFARPTGISSSSTTRASAAADFCSTRDRGGFDPICVADDNAHAAIGENFAGSLKVGEATVRCVSSNGEDVIGALCARDHKGVGSQYVSEGKVILDRTNAI